MVEYTKWVSIVWEQVDPAKVDATEVTQFAARHWRKEPELKQATVSEARDYARRVV